MTKALSLDTLKDHADKAAVPTYARDDLSPGIVHFGVGNFHRAHQAVYLHELFNKGRDHDWAIIGAGVMPGDAKMRDVLKGQDFLTTVVDQEAHASSATITGAMIDMIAPPDFDAMIDRLADPAIRIVSLTVTEGGYFIDPATGKFDPKHPAIVADGNNPDQPKTAFGLIIAGLKKRRAAGVPAFTVMCCDNIPHNGAVTKATVAGLAELSDPDFAGWIRQNVAFPNAMVDRITPATGERERRIAAEEYGIADNWPVFCEEFRQWVLEDDFPLGRPALEEVGVTFVEDVSPYEIMKLRILNGGHAAIAYPGELLDIHFVHEAMENELIAAFLEKLEKDEIIPIVPPVPDTDLTDYYELIARRFANPKIGDTIERLALDGSNRQPKFVLPSTAARLEKGLDVTGLALVSALWCRYFEGTSDSGRKIRFNDEAADRLHAAALASREKPTRFLEERDIFGSVADNPQFVKRFTGALESLRAHGTAETLKRYIDGDLE
ncbi:mannitol dehydrogenase family protein [Martelella mediterranea]|uniref:Mannitol 2-dehydrogenase n=1 Tax=Martelella mediterranea DSM 17316 TaxID=1122214 RepID=A0A1U9YXD6_9HYPH|nr:mannitol dehydrogenase family protein [Martelella mediterranea]AQZ50096.1 Mannitol 2-dehydrogenase [Martelella mediterranea DSM 17316]